jgi:DNA-nicking Smr family endonuclease
MEEIPITDVLDLHTFQPKDAKVAVEEYLYQCALKGFRYIRIIHGKGAGVHREMVRVLLQRSAYVESFQDGPDWGSTAVFLKEQRQKPAKSV